MKKFLAQSVERIVVGMFAIIILYLTLLACFSTTAITEDEHSLLIADSVWCNLVAEGIFILFLFAWKKLCSAKAGHLGIAQSNYPMNSGLTRKLILLAGSIALIFVLCIHKEPLSDQMSICQVADEWSVGVYTSLHPGGYLHIYPNQAGMVVFMYALGKVFGQYNYTVFQLINVVALMQLIRCFILISRMKQSSRSQEIGTALLCILFLPCTFYTTFVYGTLIGLSLAVTSIIHVLRFRAEAKFRHALTAVVCIFMAVFVKQNYLIFGIALILFLLYILIKDQFRIFHLFLSLGIAVAIMVNGPVVKRAVYQITNHHLGEGMAPFSWVSMGIREGSPLYDGWWDMGYSTVETFKECNYDRGLQNKLVVGHILHRIDDFRNDPANAVRFFAGKNASQWNNPDFQGWWINAVMPNAGNSIQPVWLERLLSVSIYNHTVFMFLNFLQTIILFGVVLYLLLGNRSKDVHVLLMITFIGGFIFHTVWEAKGQYTIVFFMLLLPISVDGYFQTINLGNGDFFSECRKAPWIMIKAVALVLLILVIASGRIQLLNNVFLRDEDTSEYSQYVSSNSFSIIPSGKYRMHPAIRPETSLAAKSNPENHDAAMLFFSDSDDSKSQLKIDMKSTYTKISFADINMYLDVPGNEAEKEKDIWAYAPNTTSAQRWQFRYQNDAGTYCILFNQNMALTYNIYTNRIYLDEYNGNKQQQWLLEKSN